MITAYDAIFNYETLNNCSANIEKNCAISNGTLDEQALESCHLVMLVLKKNNAECIKMETDAQKCQCFLESYKMMENIKLNGCSSVGKKANKVMLTHKKTCVKTFGACNQAEAKSSSLINVCLGGENPNPQPDRFLTKFTKGF